jgi:7-cyano-7-deazaguanine synthase
VLILSGGADSTTLLYRMLADKKEVFTLSFNYGQKHSKELDSARRTAEKLGVSHKVVDLSSLQHAGLFGANSLTDESVAVPEGRYETANMKSTTVPNRNMLMLSVALSYAISLRASQVMYGAHAGDHVIYPDCRPVFVDRMQAVAAVCHYWPVELVVPYLHVPKEDIIKDGLSLGVDYSLTWTCYKGESKACGQCGSCKERLEAFAINNATDPCEYDL